MIHSIKRPSYKETIKNTEKISKRNLPELKLAKNKKIDLDEGIEVRKQKQNQSLNNLEINSKLTKELRKPKSHSQVKKTDVMLPKIKNAAGLAHIPLDANEAQKNPANFSHINNLNHIKNQRISKEQVRADKEKILKEINEIKENTANSIKEINSMYGINSNIYSQEPYMSVGHNIYSLRNRNSKKNQDVNQNISYRDTKDKNKNNFKLGSNNYNFLMNGQKLNQRKQKSPQAKKHNIPYGPGYNTKIKSIKKENSEGSFRRPLINHTNIKLNTISASSSTTSGQTQTSGIPSFSLENPNLIPVDKKTSDNVSSPILSQINNNNLIIPNYKNIDDKDRNGNGIGQNINLSSSPSPLSDLDFMTQRFNALQNILNSLSSLSGGSLGFGGLGSTQKTVEVSKEILYQECKNFQPAEYSKKGEFGEDSIIKAYAFASSIGNIRDHNEDTISACPLDLGGGRDKTYFFGVYDGHGGSGCSEFLKENLHNYIEEFSPDGIKSAISKAEENFSKFKGLDDSGNLKDQSGSCGIMCLIRGKKLIVANVGDSRLVIFKNKRAFFETEDHKPGASFEKERIEKAGGKIYQTPSLFPLYQNGIKIEVPWRVFPGRLSVSRTFGDVETKEEKLGGIKGVVVALPDITEFTLDETYNFIVIGCDGIFDVLTNDDLIKCLNIVKKEKKGLEINELCGQYAEMIIRAAQAKDSFDNVSCVVVAFNLEEFEDIEESKEAEEEGGVDLEVEEENI